MRFNDPKFRQAVLEREESCDLFSYDAFVVTIKTEGRYYGAVSRGFVKRYPGVALPHLNWGDSSALMTLPDGKQVIFTALWSDIEEGAEAYLTSRVYGCTASAIRQAAVGGLEEIAMPPIGGGEKEARMPAMGQGIVDGVQLQADHGREIEVMVAIGDGRSRA